VASVYLGLGSNLGDRAANLWEAVRRIAEIPNTSVVALSHLYETKPVGPVEQGWFLNAVAHVDTAVEPVGLLEAVKRIEREMGRTPTDRWGPRVIDVDILLYGDQELRSEALTIPHPELWNRRFVLVPLRDVLPNGDMARQIRERLARLGDWQGDVRMVRTEGDSV
jgi:2-amino-4-hydroxy-6-hydroxymethyldihydropteridine diphosphokinase